MITNGKCRRATLEMARRLRDKTSLPVSVLIAPTILHPQDLVAMKDAGVDKVGVAIDLATPELFDRYRGTGVSGPHQWNTYWEILGQCVEIFGHPHVGAHLMVGMDETEQEMIRLMDRLWHTGVVSHLFSFFAEEASALSHRPQPPWPSYLRVQLARYLIEEKLAAYEDMAFDAEGRLKDVGLGSDLVESIVDLGTPFMTTGCLGPDGAVACNRPFGNCLPDTCQWNYPYPPNPEELSLIRKCIFTYDNWKPNGVRAEGIGPMRGKTPLQGLQKSF
jgi:biotin synthase